MMQKSKVLPENSITRLVATKGEDFADGVSALISEVDSNADFLSFSVMTYRRYM